MLENITGLQSTVANVIEFDNSSSINYIVTNLFIKKFNVNNNYVVDITTVSKLKEYKSVVSSIPLAGDKWLLTVNVDKVGTAECKKFIDSVSSNAIIIYHTDNYKSYKDLIDCPQFKKQVGSHIATSLYLGRLTKSSVDILYNYYMEGKTDAERNKFSSGLMTYVKRNYLYNPDLVCELFSRVKGGNIPTSEKDIIEMVGVGGNTPQAFAINLLSTSTKTEKGKKQFLKHNIALLNDLATKYDYSEIRAYMLDTLKGIIDIKVLQVSGKYFDWYKEIPETYDTKRANRIKRLHRFEYVILKKLSLRRVLNLKLCIEKYHSFKIDIDLLKSLCEYADSLYGGTEDGEDK